MANNASALKRVRQTNTRTERNRAAKSRLKSARRAAEAALQKGSATEAAEKVRAYVSLADKAAKSGVIHRNSASRLKGNLTAAVAVKKAKGK